MAGTLDAPAPAGLDEAAARARLRTNPGIGPFDADLVLLRATGVADVLVRNEPRLRALLGEPYRLGGPVPPGQAETLAAAWRP